MYSVPHSQIASLYLGGCKVLVISRIKRLNFCVNKNFYTHSCMCYISEYMWGSAYCTCCVHLISNSEFSKHRYVRRGLYKHFCAYNFMVMHFVRNKISYLKTFFFPTHATLKETLKLTCDSIAIFKWHLVFEEKMITIWPKGLINSIFYRSVTLELMLIRPPAPKRKKK